MGARNGVKAAKKLALRPGRLLQYDIFKLRNLLPHTAAKIELQVGYTKPALIAGVAVEASPGAVVYRAAAVGTEILAVTVIITIPGKSIIFIAYASAFPAAALYLLRFPHRSIPWCAVPFCP